MSGAVETDVEKRMVPALQEEWVVVNGLPTYVIKLGAVQPDLPLVLILPGTHTHTHTHTHTQACTSENACMYRAVGNMEK